jgi:hypothetical protein
MSGRWWPQFLLCRRFRGWAGHDPPAGAPAVRGGCVLGECGLEPFDRRGLRLVPATGGPAHGFGKLDHERAIVLKARRVPSREASRPHRVAPPPSRARPRSATPLGRSHCLRPRRARGREAEDVAHAMTRAARTQYPAVSNPPTRDAREASASATSYRQPLRPSRVQARTGS